MLTASHDNDMAGYYSVGLLAASLILVGFFVNQIAKSRTKPALRSVAIVVLGDVGRSPRMMYHAESFVNNDFETFIIGYRGESATLDSYWCD